MLGVIRAGVRRRRELRPPTLRLVAAFCAVCTEDLPVGSIVRTAPLGKQNALVAVCADCDCAPIDAWCSDRSYEAPETAGSIRTAVVAAHHRLTGGRDRRGHAEQSKTSAAIEKAPPGWKVVRVSVSYRRDSQEARPCASALYLGFEREHHLFAVPPPAKPFVSDRDPLAAIRQWEKS
jgi:hypothetical protein